jgi:hypothetical protein
MSATLALTVRLNDSVFESGANAGPVSPVLAFSGSVIFRRSPVSSEIRKTLKGFSALSLSANARYFPSGDQSR